MPPLKSRKIEQFAQGLAQGLSQTKAAIAAGYAELSASSWGSRLANKSEVKQRVTELTIRVEQQFFSIASVTKDQVLLGIMDTIRASRQAGKFSDALKGYELLGKHLKLWDRAAEEALWDGDFASLSEEQLLRFEGYFAKIIGQDAADAAKKKLMKQLEQGPIVDTTSTPAEPKAEPEPKEEW